MFHTTGSSESRLAVADQQDPPLGVFGRDRVEQLGRGVGGDQRGERAAVGHRVAGHALIRPRLVKMSFCEVIV
jgi:hypothetical protein